MSKSTDGAEEWVNYDSHRIFAKRFQGSGVPVLLMHGFPDSSRLYDTLIPQLKGRSVVTFDFVGWGRSDKPSGYPYSAAHQVDEITAVVDHFQLEQIVLVAHDASGPPAIDWAVANPSRVSCLVLLNTYYGWTPHLRRPPAIALYSTPVLRNIARAVVRRSDRLDRKLFFWQVGQFIASTKLRREVVPQLYADFRPAREAFWRLNTDLLPTVFRNRRRRARLKDFKRPVVIAFGADDRYLNVRVARSFAKGFPGATVHLIKGARHYVQIDAAGLVAEILRGLPPIQ